MFMCLIVAPSVQPAQVLYFAIEYTAQELSCSATGVPAPTISFMRGGVILDRVGNSTTATSGDISERVNLREQSQPILSEELLYTVNRTLEVLYPIGNDTGRYSCSASVEVLNQTLTDEDIFILIVQSKYILALISVDQLLFYAYSCTSV